MEVFAKPKLATRRGAHTTVADTYVAIEDDDTEEDYFRVRGYRMKTLGLVITLNNVTYNLHGAHKDADGAPESWIIIAVDQALTVGSAKVNNNEVWDFLRVQVKPTVGGAHGKLQVDIGCSSI